MILDTIKLAEDSDDELIIRMYEAAGGRGFATLVLPFQPKSVVGCDILERTIGGDIPHQMNDSCSAHIALKFAPFEVKTVRVAH